MRILVSGGSGLIGSQLTRMLLNQGHEVAHLTRKPKSSSLVKQYAWNPKNSEIDIACLENTEVIINLAGANLNARWTSSYKQQIMKSRVSATELLYETLYTNKHRVHTFISASASGYYPSNFTHHFKEDDQPGTDFLSQVCVNWEESALKTASLGIRTVLARIGIVLSTDGGVLPELMRPVKLGIGAAVGSGKQLLTWVHIDDICKMFLHAIENTEMRGAYNFGGAQTIDNITFTKAIAGALNRPILLPNVPSAVLRLVLGERAELVTRSNGMDHQKMKASGFVPEFKDLGVALKDLLQ